MKHVRKEAVSEEGLRFLHQIHDHDKNAVKQALQSLVQWLSYEGGDIEPLLSHEPAIIPRVIHLAFCSEPFLLYHALEALYQLSQVKNAGFLEVLHANHTSKLCVAYITENYQNQSLSASFVHVLGILLSLCEEDHAQALPHMEGPFIDMLLGWFVAEEVDIEVRCATARLFLVLTDQHDPFYRRICPTATLPEEKLIQMSQCTPGMHQLFHALTVGLLFNGLGLISTPLLHLPFHQIFSVSLGPEVTGMMKGSDLAIEDWERMVQASTLHLETLAEYVVALQLAVDGGAEPSFQQPSSCGIMLQSTPIPQIVVEWLTLPDQPQLTLPTLSSNAQISMQVHIEQSVLQLKSRALAVAANISTMGVSLPAPFNGMKGWYYIWALIVDMVHHDLDDCIPLSILSFHHIPLTWKTGCIQGLPNGFMKDALQLARHLPGCVLDLIHIVGMILSSPQIQLLDSLLDACGPLLVFFLGVVSTTEERVVLLNLFFECFTEKVHWNVFRNYRIAEALVKQGEVLHQSLGQLDPALQQEVSNQLTNLEAYLTYMES